MLSIFLALASSSTSLCMYRPFCVRGFSISSTRLPQITPAMLDALEFSLADWHSPSHALGAAFQRQFTSRRARIGSMREPWRWVCSVLTAAGARTSEPVAGLDSIMGPTQPQGGATGCLRSTPGVGS